MTSQSSAVSGAGRNFVDRLKQFRSRGETESAAVLYARMKAFRDPVAGRLQTTFRSQSAPAGISNAG